MKNLKQWTCSAIICATLLGFAQPSLAANQGWKEMTKGGWTWIAGDNEQASGVAGGLIRLPIGEGDTQRPIYTNNSTTHSMWVTIYDLGKTTHLDYGCVAPRSTRRWGSGNYNPGSFYYVRAEVMAKENCAGIKLYDTTVQQNFQAGEDTWKNVVTLRDSGQGYHFWSHGGSTGGPDNAPKYEKVTYGSIHHLQNGYNNWNGGFLDTKHYSGGGSLLKVSTSGSSDRDMGSGKWVILSATGKAVGESVVSGDYVYLANLYPLITSHDWSIPQNNFGGYLQTQNSGCDDNQLCVSTNASAFRDGLSGVWKIEKFSDDGMEVLRSDAVHFMNAYQYNGNFGGFLDTRGRGCEGNLHCVSTSWYSIREDGSTYWRIW